MKRPLVLALKAAVIAGLLAYLGRSLWQDRDRLADLEALRHGWRWLILAQVFIALVLIPTFYRFQLLLAAQGIHYRTGESLSLGFIGFFFSQLIPGATGGDLVKAYYVALDNPRLRAAGVTTVFLDRVVGLLVLVGVAGGAIVLERERISSDPVFRSLALVVLTILAGAVACGALFFSDRIRTRPWILATLSRLPLRDLLGKVQAAVYVYKRHPRLVAASLALSLVAQLSVVGMAICYAMALGGRVGLGSFFFIVPVAQLAMSIPIGSPGGLGQSEFAYRELFERIGYPHGLILALLQRVNWALWALVGGALYLRRRDRVRRARELARSEPTVEKAGFGGSREAEVSRG